MKRSSKPRTFQQVRLYQAAMDAALQTGKLLKSAPDHGEQTGLTSDVLRATRKVCTGIAAGWVVRQNLDLSLSHLEEAQSCAAEAAVLLDITHKMGHLKSAQAQELEATYQQIVERLGILIERRSEMGMMGEGGCGSGGCGHCHDEEE